MDKRTKARMNKAARDLQKLMDEIGPYTKRPVVKEYSTRGRWIKGDMAEEGVKRLFDDEPSAASQPHMPEN